MVDALTNDVQENGSDEAVDGSVSGVANEADQYLRARAGYLHGGKSGFIVTKGLQYVMIWLKLKSTKTVS